MPSEYSEFLRDVRGDDDAKWKSIDELEEYLLSEGVPRDQLSSTDSIQKVLDDPDSPQKFVAKTHVIPEGPPRLTPNLEYPEGMILIGVGRKQILILFER